MKTENRQEIVVHEDLGNMSFIFSYTYDNNIYGTLDEAISLNDVLKECFINLSGIDIEKLKEFRKDEIDNNTQNLIFNGFSYANKTWSLSLTAQINWSNLPSIPQSFFPLSLLSINGEVYQLPYAERMNFYLTAVGIKNSHLQSGSLLKVQIDTLTTIEDLINFTDNRI